MNAHESSPAAWPDAPLNLPAAALPPTLRSAAGYRLAAPEHVGRLVLQCCAHCATVQYPPRDVCVQCLAGDLDWQPVAEGARLVASTTLHHSHFPYFQDRLPWRIALVRLDAGPVAVVHLDAACAGVQDERLHVTTRLDGAGMGVLYARPESDLPARSSHE